LRRRLLDAAGQSLECSLQIAHSVSGLHRLSHQWQTRCSKYLVHKAIPSLTSGTFVAGIVEFNSEQRAHGAGITQQEINVLAGDPVAEPHVGSVVTTLGKEQVTQRYFWTDGRLVADGRMQHVIKATLRGG
jgi:hypothetical protein